MLYLYMLIIYSLGYWLETCSNVGAFGITTLISGHIFVDFMMNLCITILYFVKLISFKTLVSKIFLYDILKLVMYYLPWNWLIELYISLFLNIDDTYIYWYHFIYLQICGKKEKNFLYMMYDLRADMWVKKSAFRS